MTYRRREDDLLDEGALRRALRLDAAEIPARIDVATIAERARAQQPGFAAAYLVSTLVAGIAAAGILGLVAAALPAVAPALAAELFTAAIETLAWIAIPGTALLSQAAQPAIPVAAIAALAVAIAYEYAQRKEPVREVTS